MGQRPGRGVERLAGTGQLHHRRRGAVCSEQLQPQGREGGSWSSPGGGLATGSVAQAGIDSRTLSSLVAPDATVTGSPPTTPRASPWPVRSSTVNNRLDRLCTASRKSTK